MQDTIYAGLAGLITIASVASLFLPRQPRTEAPNTLQETGQVASEMRLGGSA